MAWRLAKSLAALRKQVNEKWPDRKKQNDGTIGDEKHQSSASDHNPWVKDGAKGVVTALDITHDPGSGCDAGTIAEAIRASEDPRVKYIIWNRRICSFQKVGNTKAWGWRKYTKKNPHTEHVHVSVRSIKEKYDSTAAWKIG